MNRRPLQSAARHRRGVLEANLRSLPHKTPSKPSPNRGTIRARSQADHTGSPRGAHSWVCVSVGHWQAFARHTNKPARPLLQVWAHYTQPQRCNVKEKTCHLTITNRLRMTSQTFSASGQWQEQEGKEVHSILRRTLPSHYPILTESNTWKGCVLPKHRYWRCCTGGGREL